MRNSEIQFIQSRVKTDLTSHGRNPYGDINLLVRDARGKKMRDRRKQTRMQCKMYVSFRVEGALLFFLSLLFWDTSEHISQVRGERLSDR